MLLVSSCPETSTESADAGPEASVCTSNSECPEANASRCEVAAGTCAACEANADCSHIEGKGVCDNGTCVECTLETEAERCGDNSCNPATNECTDSPRDSTQICSPCVSDSECDGDDTFCVPMQFSPDGEPLTQLGGFCLREEPDEGCPRPYSSAISRATLSGVQSKTFCGVAEPLTTCRAVLDLIEDVPKPCSAATDCGLADIDDGLCQQISGSGINTVCTYACDSAAQCPTDKPCPSGGGYCGEP